MPRRYIPRVRGAAGRPRKVLTRSECGKLGGGRPTKYTIHTDDLAANMAKLGHNDTEIAKALGIAIPTFYDWIKIHPTFSKKIEDGRSQSMTGLSYKALLKHLHGGTKKKTRKTVVKDPEGSIKEVREEESIDEVWPCKDIALQHLKATDPKYKNIETKADINPLIKSLENIDELADKIKQDAVNKEADPLNS